VKDFGSSPNSVGKLEKSSEIANNNYQQNKLV
jgi:hypothetical protein